MTNLPLYIGGRYLFAKKSRTVINVISAICVGGIAVGVAALIIILSVYNGFEELIRKSLGAIDPDLKISSVSGKAFSPDSIPSIDRIYELEGISGISETLEENVFAVYGSMQTLALAKGVDRNYEESTVPLLSIYGNAGLDLGEESRIGVSNGIAEKLGGIYFNSGEKIRLWFPSRHRKISASNPVESLNSIELLPSNVFTAGSEYDNRLVLLPIGDLRELLEYEDEVTALEIRLDDPGKASTMKSRISEMAGPEFSVKDRIGQNEALFRMMKYEKLAIFLILLAVVIIVAFSITGCLSMLIIEKKEDIGTLGFLGAGNSTVRRVFILEGWMIALLGLVIGFVLGLAAVLLQQRFGFISMPGSLSMTAYPVVLKVADLLLIAAGVAAAGYLIALATSTQIRDEKYR